MKKLLLFVILISMLSCKKDNEKNLINIEGFLLTDFAGNTMGTHGDASDDWKLKSGSSAASFELNFLSFPDTVTLNNNLTSNITIYSSYPNPCKGSLYFAARSIDSVKVKACLVDAKGNVLIKRAVARKGYILVAFDVSDPSMFLDKTSYRLYYSFSVTGNPHFAFGYGDVRICRATGTPVIECF